jgi:hypothetical protein
MSTYPAGAWWMQAVAVAAETADTFCPADTTDTDVKDCDGVNDGDTDPGSDTDGTTDTSLIATTTVGDGPTTAGEAVGEAGGWSCAAAGVPVGLLAPLVAGLLLRRTRGV